MDISFSTLLPCSVGFFVESDLARLKVLPKIREVKDGVSFGFSRSESDGRLDRLDVPDKLGVPERRANRLVDSIDGVNDTGGVDVDDFLTATGVVMKVDEGFEQLKDFLSRVGVAGIDGSVGFDKIVLLVIKLECLVTAGVALRVETPYEPPEELFEEEEEEE